MKKLLLYFIIVFITSSLTAQDCSDLFISEYIEGSGNNKAIELYNPTNDPIDLSDYILVRYRNGLFTPNIVSLEGIIASKGTFVAVIDKRDPAGTGQEIMADPLLQAKADAFLCPIYEVSSMMYFNGNDAVTLEKINGDIVDIFAHIGPPMLEDDEGWGDITDTTITYNSGGVPTQYTIQDYIVGPLFWLSWTSNHTLIRKQAVKKGVKENPAVFVVTTEWDSLPENTFDSLRFHRCDCNTSGIEEGQVSPLVNIYPNPVINGEITISAIMNIKEVAIIDLLGKVIEMKPISENIHLFSYQFEQDLQGVYFVKVLLSDGNYIIRKVVIN